MDGLDDSRALNFGALLIGIWKEYRSLVFPASWRATILPSPSSSLEYLDVLHVPVRRLWHVLGLPSHFTFASSLTRHCRAAVLYRRPMPFLTFFWMGNSPPIFLSLKLQLCRMCARAPLRPCPSVLRVHAMQSCSIREVLREQALIH